MIHIKSMVIDGRFVLFGSSNFDPRSSQINEELDLAIDDENFGDNLAHSQEYTLAEFRKRSLWGRTTEWLMQPFRSQM